MYFQTSSVSFTDTYLYVGSLVVLGLVDGHLSALAPSLDPGFFWHGDPEGGAPDLGVNDGLEGGHVLGLEGGQAGLTPDGLD